MPQCDEDDVAKAIAALVATHGFAPSRRSKRIFTRKRDTSTDRVALSLHTRDDRIECTLELTVEDTAITGWKAGGVVQQINFRSMPLLNLADPDQAAQFVSIVTGLLPFFALAAEPELLLAEASTRYVPGFVEPTTIAPYLAVRLGPAAVATYVDALLRGRPELWPSFIGNPPSLRSVKTDHGSQLAQMFASHAPGEKRRQSPADAVVSSDARAANLRGHFGLWLRAWDEREAAGQLRRVDDATIQALYTQQRGAPLDDPAMAALVMRTATGEERTPTRRTPSPRAFGYHVLHRPFG